MQPISLVQYDLSTCPELNLVSPHQLSPKGQTINQESTGGVLPSGVKHQLEQARLISPKRQEEREEQRGDGAGPSRGTQHTPGAQEPRAGTYRARKMDQWLERSESATL